RVALSGSRSAREVDGRVSIASVILRDRSDRRMTGCSVARRDSAARPRCLRYHTLVARRVVPDGVGVNNERMIIGMRHIAEAQEATWVAEVALVGGAGRARQHPGSAATAERAHHGAARIGVAPVRGD